MMLFAGTNGFIDQIPLDKMREWEARVHSLHGNQPSGDWQHRREQTNPEDVEVKLREAVQGSNPTWLTA